MARIVRQQKLHRRVGVVMLDVLGDVSHPNVAGNQYFAGGLLLLACQNPQNGGFPRAIDPDHPQFLAGVDLEADPTQHLVCAIVGGYVLKACDLHLRCS